MAEKKEKVEKSEKKAPKKAAAKEVKATGPARLQVFYKQELAPKLKEELKVKSIMEVPRLTKISLNMGVGEAVTDKKLIDNAVVDLTKIAGQKPQVRNARIAIANFKVRAGFPVGCRVTLRGKRMWEFLDRLINVAIPRMRDFRGISGKQFDGRGNFSMGINEQIIFPEIEYDKVDKLRGMNIVFTTTAKNDAAAKALMTGFSFPFRN